MAPEIQSPTCHGRVNGHISDLVQKYSFTIIPCGFPLGSNIVLLKVTYRSVRPTNSCHIRFI